MSCLLHKWTYWREYLEHSPFGTYTQYRACKKCRKEQVKLIRKGRWINTL